MLKVEKAFHEGRKDKCDVLFKRLSRNNQFGILLPPKPMD